MSDIFKAKINNQWVGIPSLTGERGPQGPQGETGPQGPAGVQVNADWTETDTSSKAYILHKPNLATVATSGSYNDLSNKPTIPASPVQSDWNESDTSSLAYIQNKPTIPAAQVNSDWNSSSGVSQILNKPNLATVATSGSYTDLSNKPTIHNVPSGGTTGQVLTKISSTNYDVGWANASSGSGMVNIYDLDSPTTQRDRFTIPSDLSVGSICLIRYYKYYTDGVSCFVTVPSGQTWWWIRQFSGIITYEAVTSNREVYSHTGSGSIDFLVMLIRLS